MIRRAPSRRISPRHRESATDILAMAASSIRNSLAAGLLLLLLAACAGITPRPDLATAGVRQTPQTVYLGGG
jgi:hypothetical protein